MATFNLELARRPGTLVVVLHGELDVATAPRIEDALASRRDDERDVVVDLRELTFVDSTGLRSLLRVRAVADGAGGRLVLVPGPPEVQRVFELTGLSAQFTWGGP